MRKFINIIESLLMEGFVPNPSAYFTDAVIDQIISNFQWSAHGSDLYRFVNEMEDDGEIDMMGMDEDEYRHTPEFKAFLTAWLRGPRSEWLTNAMSHLTPETGIDRVIRVSPEWIKALADPQPQSVGVFWAEDGYGEAHQAPRDMTNGRDICLRTSIANIQVDWLQTFLSRVDYENGDEEYEVQAVKGSPITALKIFVEDREIAIHPQKRFTA